MADKWILDHYSARLAAGHLEKALEAIDTGWQLTKMAQDGEDINGWDFKECWEIAESEINAARAHLHSGVSGSTEEEQADGSDAEGPQDPTTCASGAESVLSGDVEVRGEQAEG